MKKQKFICKVPLLLTKVLKDCYTKLLKHGTNENAICETKKEAKKLFATMSQYQLVNFITAEKGHAAKQGKLEASNQIGVVFIAAVVTCLAAQIKDDVQALEQFNFVNAALYVLLFTAALVAFDALQKRFCEVSCKSTAYDLYVRKDVLKIAEDVLKAPEAETQPDVPTAQTEEQNSQPQANGANSKKMTVISNIILVILAVAILANLAIVIYNTVQKPAEKYEPESYGYYTYQDNKT